MNSTLDKFAHFCKLNLSKQNQEVNKHAQKLIAALYINQSVKNFSLLILKKRLMSRSYPCRRRSAFQCAGEGGGVDNSVRSRVTSEPARNVSAPRTIGTGQPQA